MIHFLFIACSILSSHLIKFALSVRVDRAPHFSSALHKLRHSFSWKLLHYLGDICILEVHEGILGLFNRAFLFLNSLCLRRCRCSSLFLSYWLLYLSWCWLLLNWLLLLRLHHFSHLSHHHWVAHALHHHHLHHGIHHWVGSGGLTRETEGLHYCCFYCLER